MQAVVGCGVVLQCLPFIDCIRSRLPHLSEPHGCQSCVFVYTRPPIYLCGFRQGLPFVKATLAAATTVARQGRAGHSDTPMAQWAAQAGQHPLRLLLPAATWIRAFRILQHASMGHTAFHMAQRLHAQTSGAAAFFFAFFLPGVLMLICRRFKRARQQD